MITISVCFNQYNKHNTNIEQETSKYRKYLELAEKGKKAREQQREPRGRGPDRPEGKDSGQLSPCVGEGGKCSWEGSALHNMFPDPMHLCGGSLVI